MSATGKAEQRAFFHPPNVKLGKQRVTHQFLYRPECPIPLLGRHLLSKLEMQITLKDGEVQLLTPASKAIEARVFMLQEQPQTNKGIPKEVENAVTPLVRASEVPGGSRRPEPVRIILKPGTNPVRQKQYPLRIEAKKGLEKLLLNFIEYELLIQCESELNTPVLLVKKPGGEEYRLVQDLQAVNRTFTQWWQTPIHYLQPSERNMNGSPS